MPLLTATDRGLYCEVGDFYVDPWAPVPRAVVTHAHSDHLTWDCEQYLVAEPGKLVAESRLGGRTVETLRWGKQQTIGSASVSFHPAGHILGSAQVRVEYRGEVWVVSGDYKTEPDPTCNSYEPVRCNTFITESTFGLPIYRWTLAADVRAEMLAWCRANRDAGRASVIMGWALGKAQRLVSLLGPIDGTIWTHGAVERMNAVYRASGIALPGTAAVATAAAGTRWTDGVIVAPPSAQGSPWLRRFGDPAVAFASGWMQVRGARRRRNLDRGFVLSDHVDWPSLLAAVEATGATRVLATHGFSETVARYFREQGLETDTLVTQWEGDDATTPADTDSAE